MALASCLLRRRSILLLSRSSNSLRNYERGFASAAKMQQHGDGFDAATDTAGLDTITNTVSSYTLDTSSMWPVFRAPVTAISTFLDSVHSYTGAPWWVVLVGSTIAMRAALFPFTVLQIQKTTKFAQLAWKLPPPIPLPGTGVSYTDQFKLFVNKRKELGVPSLAWFFASFAVQVPIFITWIVAIRHMAINKFPGFDSGGILWFTDLTVPIDGNLGVLFPASVAVTYICNIEASLKGLQPKPGLVGSLVTFYSWWLRLCVIPIYVSGFYFPQGVFMYWLPNSLCSLAQTLALRNGNVRKALGLPLLPSVTKAAVDTTNVKVYQTAADTASNVKVSIDEDTDTDTLIKLAAQHVAQNKRDAAMKCLQMVIEKDPENATAYFALGKIHADANQWSEGASFLATAASMAKQEKLQIQSYLALGIALHNQGKVSEGITALKCIANMEVPQDPECRRKYYMALVTLGSMLSKDGQKAEALEYLERAAEYDPKVGELYVTKIKEELAQNNETRAEEIGQEK